MSDLRKAKQATRTKSANGTRKLKTARAAERARIAANVYCLRQYAVGYTGGTPRRLNLSNADLWIVPVLLANPAYGVVGEVGFVAVAGATYQVTGATRRDEVRAAGAQLAEEKRDELNAALMIPWRA